MAAHITALEETMSVRLKRLYKTGALFDSVNWAEKACFFTRGSLTFKEAYIRTGRVLNVSVTPSDRHSPTKLLNYITVSLFSPFPSTSPPNNPPRLQIVLYGPP